jgi:HPr kinase/phosphorylase
MVTIDSKAVSKKESITVDFFYKNVKNNFRIHLCSDESGLNRKIVEQNLHRPGLALAGFVDLFSYSRVQVFGNTEVKYLNSLSKAQRVQAFEKIFSFNLPCIIFTNSNHPDDEIISLANSYHVPVFCTNLTTTKLIYFVSDFLEDQFSLRASIHGSFVDVYGVGICFVGKSGIGKSEVALDLVERGHRLVADDVIILTKKGEGILMGAGTSLVKHFMEIRGLGLIDVEKMFGVRAIRFQKRLEVVVELELWDDNTTYTRTGLESETVNILDVEIPYVKLPIVSGKNITVIAEIISLHYLLKHYGYDAAEIFKTRLDETLIKNKGKVERGIDYFEHDFE